MHPRLQSLFAQPLITVVCRHVYRHMYKHVRSTDHSYNKYDNRSLICSNNQYLMLHSNDHRCVQSGGKKKTGGKKKGGGVGGGSVIPRASGTSSVLGNL